MDEQQQQDYIERYLNGELDNAEKTAFEEQLSSDTSLQQSVTNTQDLITGIKGTILRQEIAAIHLEEQQKAQFLNNTSENDNQPARKIYWAYGLAASVSIILLLWAGLFNSPSGQELFSEYYQQYPNLISLRNDDASSFVKGMKFYTAAQYDEAIPLLESASVAEEADRQFYLGLSHLSLQQTDKALGYLQPLNTDSNKYHQQVTWYLALAYLQAGQKARAIDQLRSIKANEYQYQSAVKLLDELE